MFVMLWIIWIIFNGRITLEISVIGMLASAFCYYFLIKYMDFSIKKDMAMCRNLGLFCVYAAVLIIEIIKCNFHVIRFILSSKKEVEPKLVEFQTNLRTKTARVILANSITLTPGTITVSLEEDTYVVHCLDREFAEGMSDSVFVKLLEKMEARIE